METKKLKIQIPEGQEIDWQESAKQEKIVFKKKDTKPRNWEEYCKQQSVNNKIGYYIEDASSTPVEASWHECNSTHNWKNVLPSEELAEAFLAMMQLMSLRQAWIGDWEPNWKNNDEVKYCLFQSENIIKACDFYTANRVLSFPTQEMASDFIITFKDLLETAKPLL